MSNENKDIEFINAVKKYPCLYDTLPNHGREQIVEGVWHAVAHETNLSVAEAKKRWRDLKGAFVRSRSCAASGTGAHYLNDCMQFVVPFMEPRGADDPESTEEDAEKDASGVLPRAEPPEENRPAPAVPRRREEHYVIGPGCGRGRNPDSLHLYTASQAYDNETMLFPGQSSGDARGAGTRDFFYRMLPFVMTLTEENRRKLERGLKEALDELVCEQREEDAQKAAQAAQAEQNQKR